MDEKKANTDFTVLQFWPKEKTFLDIQLDNESPLGYGTMPNAEKKSE